jgi:hypothetical protein
MDLAATIGDRTPRVRETEHHRVMMTVMNIREEKPEQKEHDVVP